MKKKESRNQDYGGCLAYGLRGVVASCFMEVAIPLAKYFPRRLYTAGGVSAVCFLARLLPGLRRTVAANIKEVREGLDAHELKRYVYENLANTFARKWTDAFFLSRLDKRFVETNVDVVGLEKYNAARAEGRGVLLLTCHVGSFPVLAYAALPRLGGSVLAPFRRIFHTRIHEKIRALSGANGALVAHPGGALKAILSQLRAGETVLMAADHLTSLSGMRVTYFGHETLMPAGPATLACRCRPVTMPCLCVRTETGKFRLEFGDPFAVPEVGGKLTDDHLLKLAQQYIRYFEGCVRRYPEQWECFFPLWPKSFEDKDIQEFAKKYGVVT
jgi:KDO2-lipid IV(A) lauroyltransferase